MTRKELDAVIRNNPQLSTTDAAAHPQVQNTKRQLDKVGSLEQKQNPAAGVLPRITVRILSRRVNLLDAENLWAGTKDLVDGLRYSGVIPDDSPAEIKREVEQEKVSHYSDEETLVWIIYPAPQNRPEDTNTKQTELWQDERTQQEPQTGRKSRTDGRSSTRS